MVRGFGGVPVLAVVFRVVQVALHAVVLEQGQRPGPGVHADSAASERPVGEQVAAVLRHGQSRSGDRGRGVPAGQPLVRLGQVHPVRQVGLGVLADRVVHARGHALPAPRGQAVVQCAQDGHDGHLAADVVGLPHLRGDRRGLIETSRVGIVAAVQHDPAQGQVDQVARGVIRPRAGVAERGDPGPDQPRIDRRELLIPDPAFGQVGARPGVDDDVCRLDQLRERLAALRGVKIQHDGPLAEVVVPEVQAAGGVRLVVVKRPVHPGGLASRRLHPHDIGPEAGQDLPAVLAELVADFQHPEPAQEAGELIVPAVTGHAYHPRPGVTGPAHRRKAGVSAARPAGRMARLTAARRGWSGGLDIVILPGSTVPILTKMAEFGKSEPRRAASARATGAQPGRSARASARCRR